MNQDVPFPPFHPSSLRLHPSDGCLLRGKRNRGGDGGLMRPVGSRWVGRPVSWVATLGVRLTHDRRSRQEASEENPNRPCCPYFRGEIASPRVPHPASAHSNGTSPLCQAAASVRPQDPS